MARGALASIRVMALLEDVMHFAGVPANGTVLT
jgi:hypothetical protein